MAEQNEEKETCDIYNSVLRISYTVLLVSFKQRRQARCPYY